MINFTQPVILLVAVLLFILFMILSRETKKSLIMVVPLAVFVILLGAHVIMYLTGTNLADSVLSDLIYTMIFDLIFVLISFIGYLWIDEIEAKEKQKKSLDNSLDWFWEKV